MWIEVDPTTSKQGYKVEFGLLKIGARIREQGAGQIFRLVWILG
jgi:hypothetical protein